MCVVASSKQSKVKWLIKWQIHTRTINARQTPSYIYTKLPQKFDIKEVSTKYPLNVFAVIYAIDISIIKLKILNVAAGEMAQGLEDLLLLQGIWDSFSAPILGSSKPLTDTHL